MASDDYFNVINGTLTLSAANTATGIKINLPCDWRTKTMVLIHRIELVAKSSPVLLEADGTNWVTCSLNWGQDLGPIFISDEECIAFFREFYTSHLGANEMYGMKTMAGQKSWVFKKPIPVAQDSLGFDGNTTGQTGAMVFGIRIYFTTKRVSNDDWQEVLEARHGYQE